MIILCFDQETWISTTYISKAYTFQIHAFQRHTFQQYTFQRHTFQRYTLQRYTFQWYICKFSDFPTVRTAWGCVKNLWSTGETLIVIVLSKLWIFKFSNNNWTTNNLNLKTELLRGRQLLLHTICNSTVERSSREFVIQVKDWSSLIRKWVKHNSHIPVGLGPHRIRRDLQKGGRSRCRSGHQGSDLHVTKSDCLAEMWICRISPSTGIMSRSLLLSYCHHKLAFNASQLLDYFIFSIFTQGLFLLPLDHHNDWLRQRGDQNCGRSRLLPSLWHRRHPFHALRPRWCRRHTRRTHAGSLPICQFACLSLNQICPSIFSFINGQLWTIQYWGDLGEQQGACTGVGREDGNLENAEGWTSSTTLTFWKV